MLRKRELVGFVLAPLPIVGPLLLGFGTLVSLSPGDGGAALRPAVEFLLWSYGATLLIGLPTHLILRWRRQSGLAAYLGLTAAWILAAAGLAAVAEAVMPPSPNPFHLVMWSRFGMSVTLIGLAAASISAWVFWMIAVRKTRA